VRQDSYFKILQQREVDILSIIQAYETIGIPLKSLDSELPKAFISHGKKSLALNKIERFLRELGIEPLIVKERASRDKTVNGKVNHYLEQADCIIILATGNDKIDGKLHPRQNIVHEVGLAQITHTGKIIYLLEKDTEFPSNISPKVWEPFNQQNLENVFLRLVIELKALGMIRVTKPTEPTGQ
jgi:predicted nucleotide-binding protein